MHNIAGFDGVKKLRTNKFTVMKSFPLIALLFIFLVSCDDDDEANSSISGTYQLTAIFSDPGDGSGQFNAVESSKRIIIYSDSSFQSNFSFCNGVTIEADGSGEGTVTSNLLIFNEDCNNTLPSNELNIDLSNAELIISYLCIEGCSEKYTKIDE